MALAAAHSARRRRVAAASVLRAVRSWRRMDTRDLDSSWATAGRAIRDAVVTGQLNAAASAQAYVDDAVTAQGESPEAGGLSVSPEAFAGIAADGRDLDSLLYLPVIRTKQAIGSGLSVQDAAGLGERFLRMLVDSEVADAGRAADGVGMTADRRVVGYIRVVSAGACGRCVVLAGRWYHSSEAFLRHPHCQCQNVPDTRIHGLSQHLTDSRDYFDSLSGAEQDRAFTVAGARAIRDGADVNAVVNARRSMYDMGSTYGRRLPATREGMTRRGLPSKRLKQLEASGRAPARGRLMPEAIYQLASDRQDAIRLLYRYGYLY